MRHLIIGCLLLAVATVPAWAGDVYVNDSNPATGINNHFPFNAGWSGSNGEWRYQVIYTAAHLGKTPFVITDISISPGSTGAFKATKLEVRMSHTKVAPSTTFGTNLPVPVVVRPSGPFTWSPVLNTWTPLGLTCPFYYNGVDSLTIEVRYSGGVLGGGFTGTTKRISGFGTRIYKYGTGAWSATTGSNAGTTGWKMRITHADITLSSATPSIGTAVTMLLDSSADPSKFYAAASALSLGKIPVGCWTVALATDPVFFISAMNQAPSVFRNYRGSLNASGQAKAQIAIPSLKGLIGVPVYTAFLTLGTGGSVDAVSPAAVFKIAP